MNWEKEKLPTFESQNTEYEVLYDDGTTGKGIPHYRGFDIEESALVNIEPVFMLWEVEEEKDVVGWRIKE